MSRLSDQSGLGLSVCVFVPVVLGGFIIEISDFLCRQIFWLLYLVCLGCLASRLAGLLVGLSSDIVIMITNVIIIMIMII